MTYNHIKKVINIAKKKTILIVEDDKEIHSIYKSILGKNYDLAITEDAESARAWLKKKKADLMILDIMLPNEGGDSFLADIKEDPRLNGLKVICVTVLGDLTDKLKKIDPKIICVPKPFDGKQLMDAIEKRLKER
jgi:DNA-binding response OmpR family regulator